MTVYGYARVSSKGQERDGNGLESQVKALEDAGCSEIVSEAFTGTTTDRPKLDELLAKLQDGDTFCATKLDRIARSTVQGCQLVQSLMERGVTVRVLNMGTLENTPVGRMMVSVMFAMAEFERDMIVQRTQEGLAVARQREGFHEGRPAKLVDSDVVRANKEAVERGEKSVAEVCEELGVGRTTWYKLRKAA
jgi:DNA invertase Pin-like site-specific DNA recombinase